LTKPGAYPIFLREATGLVREISWVSLLFYGMNVLGFQFTFYYIASLVPLLGSNIWFGFVVMACAMFSMILIYHSFVTMMPRSGGDYVFVSRALHPIIGFVGNMSFGVILMLFVAISAGTTSTAVLGPLFGYLGVVTGNTALVSLAGAMSTPTYVIPIGAILILGLSLFAIIPLRTYLKVQNAAFLITMIGVLTFIFVAAATTQSTFASSFNAFVGSYMGKPGDWYSNVTSSAATAGWVEPTTPWWMAGILAYPVLSVGGFFAYNAQMTGEVKDSRRSYLYASLGGALIYLTFTAVSLALTYNALGSNFLSSIDYLLYNAPSQIPLPALAYVNLLLATATNPVLAVIIIASTMFAEIYIPATYLFMSRGLFAYSFDRILPQWFAKVSERTHGPTNAVLAATATALVFFAIINIPQSATYLYLFSSVATWITAIIPAFFVGLSAAVLFKLRPNLHGMSPIKGGKLIFLGLAEMFFMALLVYLMLTNPIYGGNTPIGEELAAALIIIYILIFVIARLRRGPSLMLAFKEIPPE
jgi:amino acid transporter